MTADDALTIPEKIDPTEIDKRMVFSYHDLEYFDTLGIK
jgi:hypothetical protein